MGYSFIARVKFPEKQEAHLPEEMQAEGKTDD